MVIFRTYSSSNATNISPAVQPWILRILMALGTRRKFVTSCGFSNDAVAEALELGFWIDASQHSIPELLRKHSTPVADKDFDEKKVLGDLRLPHRRAEKQAANVTLPPCLKRNAGQLADLVGLMSSDFRLLEFAVLINTGRRLDGTSDCLARLSSIKAGYVDTSA